MRSGVLIGMLLGFPHLFVSDSLSVLLASMTFVLITGIYVGFAFIHGGESPFMAEAVVAVGYVLAALLGIELFRWIIAEAM